MSPTRSDRRDGREVDGLQALQSLPGDAPRPEAEVPRGERRVSAAAFFFLRRHLECLDVNPSAVSSPPPARRPRVSSQETVREPRRADGRRAPESPGGKDDVYKVSFCSRGTNRQLPTPVCLFVVPRSAT